MRILKTRIRPVKLLIPSVGIAGLGIKAYIEAFSKMNQLRPSTFIINREKVEA